MSKKLLIANNVFMNVISTCPCCGNSEEECYCTTLEELGATDLEVDFAIAFKYTRKTFKYITGYATGQNGYTFNRIVEKGYSSSSDWDLFKEKMTELGRVEKTDYYIHHYYSYYYLCWNTTLYGEPNIEALNQLLLLADVQLEQLKTYGKCKNVCPCCLEKECICMTLEELGATDLEVDFAIAMETTGKTFSLGGTRTNSGYTWYCVNNNSPLTSDESSSFNTKMSELGRKKNNDSSSYTDYYTYYNSSTSRYYIYWNYTLYEQPNIERLNELLTYTEEELHCLNTYGKLYIPTYNVTYNLTDECTSSNAKTIVYEGYKYTTTITPIKGYKVSNITVVMDNVNVSSSVVDGNIITIPSVTGDIVITVTTEEKEIVEDYNVAINYMSDEPDTLPVFMTLTKKSSTASYGFEHQSYDGGGYGLCSQNKGVGDSVAHGYMAIDMSDTTGTFKVKVIYNVSSEGGSWDYCRLFLTTSSTCTYSESGYFGSNGGTNYQTTNTSSTSSEMSCGSIYYLHFFYRKDSSSNTGYDKFCIKQIEIIHTA